MLGFAIGDALGFPMRGLPPISAARAQGLAEDFVHRPRGKFAKGQFSDDTQMLLAVAESVAREKRVDGKAAAQHLSWLWQEGVILQPPLSVTHSAEALLAGTPWMSAGAPMGVCDASCLSRGVVAGLWSDTSLTKLNHDAHVLTVMTHKDALCTAAVTGFAKAIQLGLSGEQLEAASVCEEVSKAVALSHRDFAEEIYHLPRIMTWDPDRALTALRRVGVSPSQYDFELGLPSHVIPCTLTALYVSLKHPKNFRDALALVLRAGGEIDVVAAMVGSLLGANLGTEAIPARLKKNVLYPEALTEAADRLLEARLSKDAVTAHSYAAVRR